MRWLVPDPVDDWTTDDSVAVSTSTDTSTDTGGARLHVLHSWSWEEATAAPAAAVTGLLGGGRHAPGEPITLGPWDVRLFRDAGGTT